MAAAEDLLRLAKASEDTAPALASALAATLASKADKLVSELMAPRVYVNETSPGSGTFTFAPTFVRDDGSHFSLDERDVEDIARAHFAHSVLLPWRKGDLLLMDNYRVVHGRLNAGEPRKVLQVMLCDYVRNRLKR